MTNNDPMAIPEGWITSQQAVDLTGYTAQYLRRLARQGRLTVTKIGSTWLFDRDSLLAWKTEMENMGTKKHSPLKQRGKGPDAD
jgi:excisionase family DNA binding protein